MSTEEQKSGFPIVRRDGGHDALRKQHGALFLAKAREEAMLRAFEPLGENPVADK